MTEPFQRYDSRGYRTVDVAGGYAAWAPFYDATMDDRLDLPLLGSPTSLDWSGITVAVDLACGTGRIGAWLNVDLSGAAAPLREVVRGSRSSAV
jgi:hypothetical protein